MYFTCNSELFYWWPFISQYNPCPSLKETWVALFVSQTLVLDSKVASLTFINSIIYYLILFFFYSFLLYSTLFEIEMGSCVCRLWRFWLASFSIILCLNYPGLISLLNYLFASRFFIHVSWSITVLPSYLQFGALFFLWNSFLYQLVIHSALKGL